MRFRYLLPSALVVAGLAGCTGSRPATPKPAAPAPAVSSAAVDCDDPTLNLAVYPECAAKREGPASQPHAWKTGLTAKVTGLQKMDRGLGASTEPGQTLVKLTLTLGNTGTAPVVLEPHRFLWRLLSSPNRYEPGDDAGNQYTGGQLTSPVPEQVAPGQTVTVFDSWDVPTDQLGALAVRVDLDGAVTPWTFVDAQTMLKG